MKRHTPPNGQAEEGTTKRSRTKHSCDQCRIKKAKCDGTEPCITCRNSGARCTYTELRKRGVRPGYVQNLQRTSDNVMSLIGLMVNTLDNGEEFVRGFVDRLTKEPDSTRHELANSVPESIANILTTNEGAKTPIAFSTTTIAEPKKNPNRRSSNHDDEESTSLEHDDKREMSPDLEPRYYGVTSGLEQTSLQGLQMPHRISDFDDCRRFIEPLRAVDLLDVYFAYGHPLFPMVDKTCVVRTAMAEESFGNTGKRCLLWTILIYALNHTEQGRKYHDSDSAQMMLRLTFCCFRSKHSVETVQALLLQAVYLWAKGYWSNSWLIIGDAVRMAIDLGLHIYSPDKPSIHHRTWKCCCSIDSLIASRLGRNCQVLQADFFEVSEPEEGEEWEIWKSPIDPSVTDRSPRNRPTIKWVSEPGRVISVFNAFCRMNKIANNLIGQANRLKLLGESELTQLLRTTAQDLREWKDTLPPHCNLTAFMESGDDNTQILPHLLNIYFAYASICHLIHIIDSRFEAIDLVPSYSEVIALTDKLLSSYFKRETTRRALPTFEYFLCLSITVSVKIFIEFGGSSSSLAKNDKFNRLLQYLEYCSDAWGSARVSYNYFVRIKESASVAARSIEDEHKSRNYTPYFVSSLQEFEGFPNLDDFQPVLGTGRSCIGALIESIEQGDISHF
uniref:ARAD1C00308p n=1 Tax=Blastobotrys adeninivorans TaxID=409370 RepID=A0A060T4T1_BLAAD